MDKVSFFKKSGETLDRIKIKFTLFKFEYMDKRTWTFLHFQKKKSTNFHFLFPIQRADVCWFQAAGRHQKKTRVQENERFPNRWHV